MREVPISTTKVKTRKPTTSFDVLFAAILAVGIPSALSAKEITPSSRHLYNYGGGDNVTTWSGIAASWNGRVFKNTDGSSEVAARDSARSECEQTTGRSCHAISVPEWWQVVAIACQRRGAVAAFVGGSAENAAERMALDKGNRAGFGDSACRTIYSSN
jgi:hypothetical protein